MERFLKVLRWFLEDTGPLFHSMNEKARSENKNNNDFEIMDDFTRAVVLSLSVCYLTGLNEKRKHVY